MTVDLQCYGTSIATATELSLAAVGDSSTTVQARPSPRIADYFVYSANAQYGRIFGPSLPLMGIQVPCDISPGLLTKLSAYGIECINVAQSDILNPVGYQDSGGAEIVYMGILLGYGAKTPYRPGKLCGQRLSPTSGTAAWGANVSAINQKADKKYQILGYAAEGTAAFFVRFNHPDFLGLRPGGPAIKADVLLNNEYFFPKQDVPTFSGSTPLQVQAFGDGNAVAIDLILNEI